jgi:hypothetical protein
VSIRFCFNCCQHFPHSLLLSQISLTFA